MFTLSVISMIGSVSLSVIIVAPIMSLSVMPRYGNMVPRTEYGKIATMVYAVFGIPVYVLYFMNMGKVFAEFFKWIYCRLYRCTVRRSKVEEYDTMDEEAGEEVDEEEYLEEDEEEVQVLVPSTACVWVMLGYLLTGTIMFAEWEQWNYLDSTYFCVISLLKIGLGDFVPGTSTLVNDAGQRQMNNVKLIINFLYLLGRNTIARKFYYATH